LAGEALLGNMVQAMPEGFSQTFGFPPSQIMQGAILLPGLNFKTRSVSGFHFFRFLEFFGGYSYFVEELGFSKFTIH